MSDGDTLSRPIRILVRVLAGLGFALFVTVFGVVAADSLGVISSQPVASPQDPPPSPEALAGAERPGEAVHIAASIAALVTGGAGLLRILIRPDQPSNGNLVLVSMIAMLISVPIVGNPNNYGGQAGAIDPLFVIVALPSILASLLLRPWRSWRRDGRKGLPLLVLLALAALPAAWYGTTQALIQRNTFPPTADPHHNAHWWVVSVVAFMVVGVTASAAISPSGSRVAGVLAGLAALILGANSVVFPMAASAMDPTWGVAAVVWGSAALWLATRRSGQRGVHR